MQRGLTQRRATAALATRVLVHVVVPLAIGTLAYASWRSTDVRIVSWMSRIAPRGIAAVQGSGASHAPAVILGSLPDLAWAWAFGASLSLLWLGRPWREKAPWLVGGGFLALLAEVGQGVGVVRGTFDTSDLVAIALGFAAGALLASGVGRAPTPTRAPTPGPSRSRAR